MACVEDNEPQVQETIDDSFPESGQPVTKPRSQAPSNSKPQKSRPHTEEEDDYVSSQVHHQDQMPAQFPPQNSEYHELPNQHVPPPVSSQYHHQDQMPAQFPPQNSEYHALPNQHVPPPTNMHFAHQVPPPQMSQPVMASPVQPFNVVAPQQDKAWNSNLFDCMNDPQNALITACFPCITFGQISEILDYGNTTCVSSGVSYGFIAFCFAIPCIMSCTYRTKLRARFGLMESPAQDWVVHCFCECCALCQEYRELQHMGSYYWLDGESGEDGESAEPAVRNDTSAGAKDDDDVSKCTNGKFVTCHIYHR